MFGVEPGAILQILSAVCTALLAARLYSSGLAAKYRIFFVYTVFRIFYLVSLKFLRTDSDWYFYFFVFTEPIVWLLYVGVTIELFRLILERHRGFYTLGRRAMFVVMAISVAISLAALAPGINANQNSSKVIGLVLAGERAFDLSLALFLLLMLVFLNLYTVPLSRNVVVHAVVFTVFFLSNTLTMVLRTVFGMRYANELNLALMGLSWACSLAWLLFLTPAGESLRAARPPWFSREREERILWQLDSINAMLVKAGRK